MTDTIYFLAPNARWQARDLNGQPLVGGKLYTYRNGTTTPKATYQDAAHTIPNTNPVIMNGAGEAIIYWASDELYSIDLKTSTGGNVWDQDGYPEIGITPPVNIATQNTVNIVRNPQFSYWFNGSTFNGIDASSDASDFIADDWLFFRSNLNATINITRQSFTLGDNTIPGNPLYFLRYQCINAGAGSETYKYVSQYYASVNTLSGQEVTVSFWAKSDGSEPLDVNLVQFFGTGGSPSADVATQVVAPTLTTTWTRYSATVTLPSVSGKTPGSNGNDSLQLRFNMPLNDTAVIDLVNIQMQLGNQVLPFPWTSLDDQIRDLNTKVPYSIFETGDVKPTYKATASNGWLMMDEKDIGNLSSTADHLGLKYKALFTTLWNNVSDSYAPVSTGRGANAEADWNANKKMTLMKSLGRAIAGSGTASGVTYPIAYALGQPSGDNEYKLTPDNLAHHTHTLATGNFVGDSTGFAYVKTAPTGTPTFQGATSPATDSNLSNQDAFSVEQPTLHANYMIKL